MITGLTISQRNREESEEDQWDDMEDVIDSAMASATARFASGVNPEHMSKTWRISHEDAERTLDNTTHLLQRTTSPELSRNYGTNDRMLRYERIKDSFYRDTIKKEIIKIRSRQHEHTSQCDGPAWLEFLVSIH
jgi:hypothetical protein